MIEIFLSHASIDVPHNLSLLDVIINAKRWKLLSYKMGTLGGFLLIPHYEAI